jgi:hypothetical protein
MADVQIAARIGQHSQCVMLGFAAIHARVLQGLCLPPLLPLGLDLGGYILVCHSILHRNENLFVPGTKRSLRGTTLLETGIAQLISASRR